MPSAYLLVSHGSRDPRPQVAMNQLARLVSASKVRVERSGVQVTSNTSSRNPLHHSFQSSAANQLAVPLAERLVGAACLELSALPLHEQIKEFGDRAVAAGYNRVQVVPLFLLPGVHVMEDIPEEVAIAQQHLGQKLKLDLRPYVGTHPDLSHLLANQLAATKADAWILLAHGSRRAGSKQPVEAITKQLKAVSAYWAVAPRLEARVKQLVGVGHRQIGIVPYFLFAGGITDAIAQSVEQLQGQFPSVNLYLAEPLGASAELANLVLDLID
ncbi:sirohydrochlorin chelatase [Chroococcidiopsis sp. CCMEE 29]|uniref:sirohydrochlorin chelatase n=1 Tax=Chroococcidiopsis sp. CCMEE 29 TaxID=155894 RepID=UPI0020213A92|nr:sirohydrochlorin chelatase [Chroococcidiopsis sp. CCMEE 29]